MKQEDKIVKQHTGTYLGLFVVCLALLLWTAGCGGGGGGGGVGSEPVSAAGGSGTATGVTGGGSTTGTGGTTGGGTLNSSTPPAPPQLAIPRALVSTTEFVPNRVLVKVRPAVRAQGSGVAPRDLSEAAAGKGLDIRRKRRFKKLQTEEIEIESGQSVEEAVDLLSQLPEVEYAEPDFILTKTETIPNDSFFGDLWAHKNTGQSGGTVGADIESTFAWDIQTGNPSIVISVIDTGVDYNHPDIAANMWRNPGEDGGIPGVDDDNNGYVDDIFGINAITGSGDPLDDEGHGTHVAGIAAAVGNNNQGVVGVAFNSRIMALKFLNESGTGTTSDAIECLEYAVEHGAKVTNASWGGSAFSTSLFNAIQSARSNDHLFVAAAGNSGSNVDASGILKHYPSGFNLDNIISVGASERFETIASFSNFGTISVDLFAPGRSIRSTIPNNNYAFFSGTSMASPHVAGVAALLYSQLGAGSSYSTIRNRILENVEVLPAYQGRCATDGRLNAYYALDPSASPTPGPTTPAPSPTNPPAPTPIADSVSLAAGWNLISFPTGQVTSITLPTGVQNVFWIWNPASQSYQSIAPTAANINAGSGTSRGFWVFSDVNTTINYQGLPTESRTLVLEPGWNLMGLPRESTITTAQLTLTNLANFQENIFSNASCDDIPASPPCLVFQYMFFWTGSYANLNASQGTSLGGKRAYWVHAWTRSEVNFFPLSTTD